MIVYSTIGYEDHGLGGEVSQSRLLIFGDLHGAISSLRQVIARLVLRKDDTLLFLGDYIDRGENSRAVLDYLMELERTQPCIFLKGNHEDMFLQAYAGNAMDWALWLSNGGHTTLRDFGGELPAESYVAWLQRLRYFHETPTHYFVHAGLRPNVPPEQTTDQDRMWIREPFLSSEYDWGKQVVFGHTVFLHGPVVLPNKIGIDTGAFTPMGRLTCLVLPEGRFVFSKGRSRRL